MDSFILFIAIELIIVALCICFKDKLREKAKSRMKVYPSVLATILLITALGSLYMSALASIYEAITLVIVGIIATTGSLIVYGVPT